MIVLFTDFGVRGPYVGQVKAVLSRDAPGVPVVDLMADAPAHDPKPAAYLLAALAGEFPAGSVFFAVVDPGVGGARLPGVLAAGGRWYVGPGNGLFELILRRAESAPGGDRSRWWEIVWRPNRLSATFHGRDLFAPVAARIARGERPADGPDFREAPVTRIRHLEWPDDLAEVIYIDDFGNAMTGLRADMVADGSEILVSGRVVRQAEKYTDLPTGEAFWYENSNGLVEIAVNRGRADAALSLRPGSQVFVRKKM
ncbi:MAG: SAM-dependent chlorinase/fluorinase [Rhodospirillales bacterium]|nr:SAM-dependent chlorinase/fluorinase [Rhodospirillales bacterium]